MSDYGPQRIDALRALAVLKFGTPRQDVFRCSCSDTGFVEHDDGFTAPCARCNAATFQRWRGGKYVFHEGSARATERNAEADQRRAEHERFGSRRDIG